MPERPPKTHRRHDTRQALLRAAMGLLAEHGYAGATTGRIARAAGIKQPSFYAHFESQDACLAEAIRLEGDALADRLARRLATLPELDEAPAPQSVRMLFVLLLQHLRQRPDFARVLHSLLDAENLAGEAVRAVLTRIRDGLVADLPRFGVAPRPDDSLRMDMLVAMAAQAERGLRWGDYELEAIADLLAASASWLYGPSSTVEDQVTPEAP